MADEYVRAEGSTFVNPYTFVPVNFENAINKKTGERVASNNLKTGKIKCKIVCKTPIAIPGRSLVPENELGDGNPQKYDFFRTEEEGAPVIPGSSLRGVIRNVFETITDSCFSTMKPDTKLTQRRVTMDAKPGILKREGSGWALYQSSGRISVSPEEIKKCMDANRSDYRDYNGKLVGYEIGKVRRACRLKVGNEKNKCKNQGYLYIGEPIERKENDEDVIKKYESIFENELTKVPLEEGALDVAMKKLESTLKDYRNSSSNQNYKCNDNPDGNHMGYPDYESMKNRGTLPIWFVYDEKTKNLLLSFAALGRTEFNHTLNDLVKEKQPCTSREALCPACRIFGMIGKRSQDQPVGKSLGSRVRFTDTTPGEKVDVRPERVTLRELASPRPSYMPFYSTAQSDAYGINHYPGYDEPLTIRGRKFYWHSDWFDVLNKEVPGNKRNAAMQLVEKGSDFFFDVYFENLQDTELETLIWSLNLGENNIDGSRMHKIGHGKPIGLGSVKIVVDAVECRTFNLNSENAYCVKSKPEFVVENEKSLEGVDLEAINALLKVSNFYEQKEKGKYVRYPYIVDGEKPGADGKFERKKEPYNWFVENRKKNVQLLPDITAKKQTLTAMEMN